MPYHPSPSLPNTVASYHGREDDDETYFSHSLTLQAHKPYGDEKPEVGYGYSWMKQHSQETSSSSIYASSMNKPLPSLHPRMDDDAEFSHGLCPEDHSYHHHTGLPRRDDLQDAIGLDAIPQTTQIDTLPCAGVRIPHGKLKGLVAWCLVVKIVGNHSWQKIPRKENSAPNLGTAGFGEHYHIQKATSLSPGYEEKWQEDAKRSPSPSAHSFSSYDYDRASSSSSSHRPPQRHLSPPPIPTSSQLPSYHPSAITTNFILDTTHSTSLIPSSTLLQLGFKPATVISGRRVKLDVQGVCAEFTIGADGDAGRLGLDWMLEAGASFRLDREFGMPVLYTDMGVVGRDIPRTVKLDSTWQKVRKVLRLKASP
ncbi:hypothetical protein BDQ12DRAFT_693803 [Crucibulum laeve]|uniref:Uncharacterized protein n=1 Tax=Crucibulum laeve TaxID=68775 RepID=A0A5C3LFJ4_9AGAR|nr:hypothetical protein BDQ12DRAFT_693803 [Crucibulum laeve]